MPQHMRSSRAVTNADRQRGGCTLPAQGEFRQHHLLNMCAAAISQLSSP